MQNEEGDLVLVQRISKKKIFGHVPQRPLEGSQIHNVFSTSLSNLSMTLFSISSRVLFSIWKTSERTKSPKCFWIYEMKQEFMCTPCIYPRILIIVQNATIFSTIFSVLVWLVFALLMSQYFAWIRILTETHFENFCSYRDK